MPSVPNGAVYFEEGEWSTNFIILCQSDSPVPERQSRARTAVPCQSDSPVPERQSRARATVPCRSDSPVPERPFRAAFRSQIERPLGPRVPLRNSPNIQCDIPHRHITWSMQRKISPPSLRTSHGAEPVTTCRLLRPESRPHRGRAALEGRVAHRKNKRAFRPPCSVDPPHFPNAATIPACAIASSISDLAPLAAIAPIV